MSLELNMNSERFSLLMPEGKEVHWRCLSKKTLHDLGLDDICQDFAVSKLEQNLILNVFEWMSDDPELAAYRLGVFEDIYANPELSDRLLKSLQDIDFIRDYGSFRKETDDSASTWDMLHRLEEVRDYIRCIEALGSCLSEGVFRSEGMLKLKDFIDSLYHESGFEELKKDVDKLSASTTNLKSVTLGINLNERFEADSVGLISINSKAFNKSGIIGGFVDKLMSGDRISEDTQWNENFRYYPFSASEHRISENDIQRKVKMAVTIQRPLMGMSMANVPEKDISREITSYTSQITDQLLSVMNRKLRDFLQKYAYVTITDITALIPELIYYIRMAAYVHKMEKKGYSFCVPKVLDDDRQMKAKGFYNMKLIKAALPAGEIVDNDLIFDEAHRTYILTGANRGGKTTITQAVGQMYVLAQAGIRVPGNMFMYSPVDAVFTHFPADEDKTLDLGRLGEECSRFRQLYMDATSKSLLLLNETFSTTSFEEGYYIAKDSVRAILAKGIRTIYNTHMHKLGFDTLEMNKEKSCDGEAASLIVESENGKRSFKVKEALPGGKSFAQDIANKYGVTFEMLTGE